MFKSKSNKASKAKLQQPIFKQDYFKDCHRTYSCIHCRAHLANHDELISKLFQGNHGRAYLFNKVVNIGCKPAVERELLTGLHAVADIYCDSCETTLGWKYEQAFVPSQKYKEGKYIIELVHMLKENNWDLTSYNARDLLEEDFSKASSLERDKQLFSEHIRFGGSRDRCRMSSERGTRGRREGVKKSLLNRVAPRRVLPAEIIETSTSANSNATIAPGMPHDNSTVQVSDGVRGDNLAQQEAKDLPNFPVAGGEGTATADLQMSNGLELIERSLNRLTFESAQSDQLINRLDLSSSSTTQSLPSSPKNSLYSTRSPSDMSSSASAADGNINEEETQ